MRRTILTMLCFLSVCLTYGQDMSVKSRDINRTTIDTITSTKEGIAKKSWFKKAIARFFDFGRYDTTYIEPNHYNYALMSNYAGNYESYKFTDLSTNKNIELAPNVTTRVGLYFGWRWIFLGYTIDTGDLIHSQPKNRNSEFVLSLYSSKIGVDIYSRKTGNDFKIKALGGFEDKDTYLKKDFDGLRATMKGINLYYILNNNHFSYPAAYSQSTNQKISCGSWIAGLSYSEHNIDFDISKLPTNIIDTDKSPTWFSKVKYNDFNLNIGYSYNWVFARNMLFNISFTPAIAYKESKVVTLNYGNKDINSKGAFNFDILGRSSIIYNTGKYYFGALATLHGFNYKQNTFEMFNMFTNFQVYLGFNFSMKKEYKKHSTKTK